MKKIMTLAIIAFASIAMVACCGEQKPAEVAECAACCEVAAPTTAEAVTPAATEEAPACTKECETCPKKADCPKAK